MNDLNERVERLAGQIQALIMWCSVLSFLLLAVTAIALVS